MILCKFGCRGNKLSSSKYYIWNPIPSNIEIHVLNRVVSWSGMDSEGCHGYHWITRWLLRLIWQQQPISWHLYVYASKQVYCGLIFPSMGKRCQNKNDIKRYHFLSIIFEFPIPSNIVIHVLHIAVSFVVAEIWTFINYQISQK